jgi:ribosomal protein S12 methylthiotransferase
MQDQFGIAEEKNEEHIGNTYRVLIEGYDHYSDSYYGRSYMDAPEIDSRILFTSEKELFEGDFADVEIINISEYDLLGKAINR